jgi:hypothetical protein
MRILGTLMNEYMVEDVPSCGFTILGMFFIGFTAAIPILLTLFLDLDNPQSVTVLFLIIGVSTVIIMLGGWWAMKRTRLWIKSEIQKRREERENGAEDEI